MLQQPYIRLCTFWILSRIYHGIFCENNKKAETKLWTINLAECFPIVSLLKYQKTKRFLMFSGGIKGEHRAVMG